MPGIENPYPNRPTEQTQMTEPTGPQPPFIQEGGGRLETEINPVTLPPDRVLDTDGNIVVNDGEGVIYTRFGKQSPWRYVGELRNTRQGSPQSAGYDRTYVRRFLVRTYRDDIGSALVSEAPGIPRLWHPYIPAIGAEYDLDALVVDVTPTQFDPNDRRNWIVTVTYSTVMPEEGPDNNLLMARNIDGSQRDPSLRPPKLTWDEEEIQKAPQQDLDGRPYKNSANQPFSPAPTFPVTVPVLVMVRYEKKFGPKTMAKFSHALNADLFLGRKPGTVQCMAPRGEQKWVNYRLYWKVTWRFRFSPPKPKEAKKDPGVFDPLIEGALAAQEVEEFQTWQPEVLDQGTHQKQFFLGAPLSNHPVPIVINGSPVSHPVLLNGNGRMQKPDANGYVEPKFRYFRQFPTVNFHEIFAHSLTELEGGE